MAKDQYLTVQEATKELGVSAATLYAYVSRGLIRSEPVDGKKRVRRYHREDLQRLKERKELRRNPAKLAEQALHWGAPVLESAITLIANGRLYYRGHDVLALAATRTVEEVAGLIWLGTPEVDVPPLFAAANRTLPPRCSAVRQQLSGLPLTELFHALLPVAAAEAVEHLIHVDNLLHRVRRTRLLTVTESGVGDVKLGRRVHLLDDAVEDDLGHLVVGKDVTQQVRFRNILQLVALRAPGLLL